MYIARILYPVKVLGPGKRVGIWFCGCPRRCKACSNPELWDFQDKYKTTVQTVYEIILELSKKHEIDGFTITGGDPLYQAEQLQDLIVRLNSISKDILVYTGYKLEELSKDKLKNISVLIDGEYLEEQNDNSVLRGSNNQKIHILDSKLKDKYDKYLKNYENQIQNFTTAEGIVSVGIHKKGFLFE